jgi:hypothetical protein
MRNVSLDGLRSMIAQQTDSIWVFGVTFIPGEGDSYPVTRYCNNTENFRFPYPSGDEYVALPFEVTLASENEESVPQARIRIDNVSLVFSNVIRRTDIPPEVELRIFRLEEEVVDGEKTWVPYLELGPSAFTLLGATVNSVTVEGTIGYEHDILNEPAVQHRFTPTQAPAMFS